MESKDTTDMPAEEPVVDPPKRKRGRPRKQKKPKANRPLNSYQQWFSDHYKLPEIQALSVRERTKAIALSWREHKKATK